MWQIYDIRRKLGKLLRMAVRGAQSRRHRGSRRRAHSRFLGSLCNGSRQTSRSATGVRGRPHNVGARRSPQQYDLIFDQADGCRKGSRHKIIADEGWRARQQEITCCQSLDSSDLSTAPGMRLERACGGCPGTRRQGRGWRVEFAGTARNQQHLKVAG